MGVSLSGVALTSTNTMSHDTSNDGSHMDLSVDAKKENTQLLYCLCIRHVVENSKFFTAHSFSSLTPPLGDKKSIWHANFQLELSSKVLVWDPAQPSLEYGNPRQKPS